MTALPVRYFEAMATSASSCSMTRSPAGSSSGRCDKPPSISTIEVMSRRLSARCDPVISALPRCDPRIILRRLIR